MKKNAALKLCIDGAKVRRTEWVDKKQFIFWDGSRFMLSDGTNVKAVDSDGPVKFVDGWEIYKEPKKPIELTKDNVRHFVTKDGIIAMVIRDTNAEKNFTNNGAWTAAVAK